MAKIILKTQFDGDVMSFYNVIVEINEALTDYNLSLEVEDEEHDGYDVVILKEI